MPGRDGGGDERNGARNFTEARPEARERLLEARLALDVRHQVGQREQVQ